MVTFARPDWLWWLLALPVYVLVIGYFEFRSRRRRSGFAENALFRSLAPTWNSKRIRWQLSLMGVFFACALVALARPQWGVIEKTIESRGADIVVALDLSNSMLTEDVVPNRLDRSKHFIRELLRNLSGDRVGIVAFAGSAFPATPLTTDLAFVSEVIESLGPQSISNQGTDIGLALKVAAGLLRRGGQAAGERKLILITDAEDLRDQRSEGVRMLRELEVQTIAVGVGTERGGPIPLRDAQGYLRGYKRDAGQKEVASKFNRKTLEKLASELGASPFVLSSSGSETAGILSALQSVSGTTVGGTFQERKIVEREERFQWPLSLGVLCFVISLLIPLRAPARAILRMLGFVTALGVIPAHAAEPHPEVYLHNRSGLKALENGNVEKAQESFSKGLEKDPGNPTLLYNQGLIELEKKDPKAAVLSFETAAQAARERGEHEAESLYNLGSTYEKRGKYDEAVESFLRGLDAAKRDANLEMEKEIRKRLSGLTVKPPPQKGGGQGEGEQQDQSGEQSSESEKGDDGSKDKKDQEGGPQKFKNQSSVGKRFKSKKLSREDAERVLGDLTEQEKATRGRLDQKRPKDDNRGQDW